MVFREQLWILGTSPQCLYDAYFDNQCASGVIFSVFVYILHLDRQFNVLSETSFLAQECSVGLERSTRNNKTLFMNDFNLWKYTPSIGTKFN